MARRQWVVELSDGSHTVELDHSVITGKRAIRVDGRQVALPGEDTGSVIDFGGRARVAIGESTGVVHIRTNGLTYSYDLAIDGRSVETGQSRPEPPPEEEGRSVPAWGWVAVALCVALPIATLGGALPAALGAGGALACYGVARDVTKPAATRAGVCAAIVAGCWTIAIAVIVAVQ